MSVTGRGLPSLFDPTEPNDGILMAKCSIVQAHGPPEKLLWTLPYRCIPITEGWRNLNLLQPSLSAELYQRRVPEAVDVDQLTHVMH